MTSLLPRASAARPVANPPTGTPATFAAAAALQIVRDFGARQVLDELVSFSRQNVTEAAVGQAVDGANIDTFRSLVPVSIASGVESCLQRCGIAKK